MSLQSLIPQSQVFWRNVTKLNETLLILTKRYLFSHTLLCKWSDTFLSICPTLLINYNLRCYLTRNLIVSSHYMNRFLPGSKIPALAPSSSSVGSPWNKILSVFAKQGNASVRSWCCSVNVHIRRLAPYELETVQVCYHKNGIISHELKLAFLYWIMWLGKNRIIVKLKNDIMWYGHWFY